MFANTALCSVALLLIAAASPSSSQVVNYGRCFTPNGERALCIKLEQCPFLYNKLTTKPLLNEDRQFLSRSQCGYNGGNVLICCPDRYIGTNANPATTDTRMRGNLPQPGTCGNVISNKIFGGVQTKIDEYPWMALIEYNKGDSLVGHHCGASLINDRYVVTAAHCIKAIPETWSPFRVRLGEWDTSTDRDCEKDVRGVEDCAPPHIDVEIEKVITHEKYQPSSKSQTDDIALIRLARTVRYTDFVRPICLPVQESLKRSTLEGIGMDVAGWGRTENGSTSDIKLKASVSVVPLQSCAGVYAQRNVQLQNSQLCAGGKLGVDSCRGDSGGPLIGLDTTDKRRVYYFLSGIVSFGPTPCGLEGWPGVYTKVSEYVDWIQQNIQP